jgi:DNA-binding NarL/FixJ family response regulator
MTAEEAPPRKRGRPRKIQPEAPIAQAIAAEGPLSIYIADDHTLFRELLCEALPRKNKTWTILGEAATGTEAIGQLRHLQPDILLLDYRMPGLGRLSVFCREVARRAPRTRVILVSGYADEEAAIEAASGGAYAYVLKGGPLRDLMEAMVTVMNGKIWVDPRLPQEIYSAFLRHRVSGDERLAALSRQELRVLSLIAQGNQNKAIAEQLGVSLKTVKNHAHHLFVKLGISKRREVIRFFPEGKVEG